MYSTCVLLDLSSNAAEKIVNEQHDEIQAMLGRTLEEG